MKIDVLWMRTRARSLWKFANFFCVTSTFINVIFIKRAILKKEDGGN